MGTTAVGRRDAMQLASPAVLSLGQIPGAEQLLFAGEVRDLNGVPVDNAVVSIWGIDLHAEASGRFELLAYGPRSGATPVPVTVTAPNHIPLSTSVAIDEDTKRLDDGTLAVVHTFVVETGELR
ncbi:hypothetical protein [uncultured Jatrophihabitans sp.]|uniref:hypothetical protein n=1 Tax=uncultured Jatrophihabitans sp. TaxID=1610747 RepID=UPI0035CC9B39